MALLLVAAALSGEEKIIQKALRIVDYHEVSSPRLVGIPIGFGSLPPKPYLPLSRYTAFHLSIT